MKGLFYFRTHYNDLTNLGVVQKCEAYTSAFQRRGISVDVLWYDDKGLIINNKITCATWLGNQKKSLGHFLMFYLLGDLQLARTLDFQQYDFILIRHMPTHPMFLYLLKQAKKANPKIKIIIELPTWPYDAEMKGWIARIMLGIDRLFRSGLQRRTDRFLHYGTETQIWGVPTIFVQNGIDVQRIPEAPLRSPEHSVLRMTFIGSVGYWHGLDRLLSGMRTFLDRPGQGPVLHLKILGSGAESEEIRLLVDRLALGAQVQLIPPQSGKDFDALMAQTDIGIGTLGIHRIGIPLNSALKHRTYCAYGLPFVFAGSDADFPETFPFCHRIPADENPVEIEKILEFMENLRRRFPEATREIRAYAEATLDWENKIKPVLGYLGADLVS